MRTPENTPVAQAPTVAELADQLQALEDPLLRLTASVRDLEQRPRGGDSISVAGGGRVAATLTVAPSNASTLSKLGADYVLPGIEDDRTLTKAGEALPADGGILQLLEGDVHLGASATSFVNIITQKGGITLRGSGRRQGTIIHVPAGSAAPCAVRMGCWGSGSQTARDLYITFDGAISGTTCGLWMQCNEPQVKDVVVNKAAGHGIVIDGEPKEAATTFATSELVELTKAEREARALKFVAAYSGHVDGCEASGCGAGINQAGGAGLAGDGYLVTTFNQNTEFSTCFVDGGNGYASAMLDQEVVEGTEYTELTVYALSEAMTIGDQLLLVNAQTSPVTWQVLTAAATAAKGATKVKVTAFIANANYKDTTKYTFLVDTTKMVTRDGFRIEGIAHLTDCHPYWCWRNGANVKEAGCLIAGGEYETNGWCNVRVLASTILDTATGIPVAPVTISNIVSYGNPAYAGIFALDMELGSITGNVIDGGTSCYGIYAEECVAVPITANTILNAIQGYGSTSSSAGIFVLNGERCNVAGNTISQSVEKIGTHHYGIETFNHKKGNVGPNTIQVKTASESCSIAGEGMIARGNTGYNPVGVVAPAVPATTVAVAEQAYDRVFYITTAAGVTKVAISGGPTITLPVSTLSTVSVPAGTTLTPTYENEPKWVVEGE